jgi:hypothetical protein
MSHRWIGAASLLLAWAMLVWPLQAPAQAESQAVAARASADSAPPITVQIGPPPISISSSMLGVSSLLGAQSASGKPIYAEFITEHHQSFTDGNRISRSTFSCIYRDVQGRIRRESQISVPGLEAGIAAAPYITIVDRPLGFGYVLDPQERVAHRYELNAPGPSYVAHLSAQSVGGALLPPDAKTSADANAKPAAAAASTTASAWRPHAFSSRPFQAAADGGAGAEEPGLGSAPSVRIDQPFLAAPNPVRTENLGEQLILGFRARGTRVITTLPAGQIGNDRPIDIVSEQWFSPDLELVMRSMHHDPWAGEFTTTVTKVSQGDQPAALFEIPPPYKIIDTASEHEHHVLDGHGSHSVGSAPW